MHFHECCLHVRVLLPVGPFDFGVACCRQWLEVLPQYVYEAHTEAIIVPFPNELAN